MLFNIKSGCKLGYLRAYQITLPFPYPPPTHIIRQLRYHLLVCDCPFSAQRECQIGDLREYIKYSKLKTDLIQLIGPLLMGCIQNETNGPTSIRDAKNTKPLIVATLNYCGIMNSPFEFYCEDYLTQLKTISNQFLKIIPEYFPNFNKTNFKWDMGKIDLKFRNRYSPMFQLQAGIENNKFISEEAFCKKWETVFNAEMPKLKVEYKEEQKETTKKYDLAMYHTLLRHVYSVNKIQDALNLPTDAYIKRFKPLFELSFLDQKRKGEKVQKNFKRINADIFFFQEYSEGFYESLKKTDEYHMASDDSKDTMIIAKKSSFKNDKPGNADVIFSKRLDQQLKNDLNWAQRSAFLIIDNYFLICAHLSSKKEKNEPQIKLMKETLIKVRQKLPDYQIILGGDLNSFLQPFSPAYHIFPQTDKEMTTVKKRTSTQGQFNKAQKVVCESKDKIISTLPIKQGRTSYITGNKPSSDNLVPTDEHPFDHFVLVTVLQRKQP